MAENKNAKLQIRNSTVDFLVFTKDAHEDGIEVRVQDHDVSGLCHKAGQTTYPDDNGRLGF